MRFAVADECWMVLMIDGELLIGALLKMSVLQMIFLNDGKNEDVNHFRIAKRS